MTEAESAVRPLQAKAGFAQIFLDRIHVFYYELRKRSELTSFQVLGKH
ncbi:hypothetical protein M9Y82_16680 [Leptospira weilii]|nr:hypothetical protein [Leptospira weilii]MCL8268232.1 hypothetical protein [Leptospira weilii]